MDTDLTRPSSVTGPDPIDTLPPTFRWGVATSSYQIEGAVAEDGRTPSIWDTFCRVPGAVANGDHGDVACDHYHRMPQDVALIADLGLDTYRFSVAWPRVQPGGRGPANVAGLAFYDRLVDELLGRGVEPWVTLYHWDLPQELEDAGGWPNRDTAYRFADYAELVFAALGDRVRTWTTLNEPWCSAMLGYAYGNHAPGRRDLGDGIAAAHHLLLGHGLATRRLREAARSPIELGLTLNLATADPATDSAADRDAARAADGLGNRLYLDPVLRGEYPRDVIADLAAEGVRIPVEDGDLDVIATPIDVLGVNYYFGQLHSGVDEQGRDRDDDGKPVRRVVRRDLPRTAMDWEIVPESFTDLLVRLHRDYPGTPMVITENGAAFDDEPDADGFVADDDRVGYLTEHLRAVARARAAGADVRGYFAWSLLDNFEWAYGYDKRFGIVRVDYDTQRRTPKRSALWYRDTVRRVRGQR
ncbi:GH1 family beta-glucosidase [Micromonospora sp. WMMA1949]|uniref:GH1 family beta-glucosidase n=1 Tax=unclassified Micromonospora TaxID=2617518 RepID=UPI0022B66519|nr:MULTISPECIES: GH1 family beta-glucosidase [unclassified Micromonospora]MCZ7429465.1 GH1 family beta-glucosidase [Micromonospora sp. WMMA1949]WBC08320.1 GH1 family beta-glucosidase [Micromonospora sp. WMMA1947]